MGYEMMSQLKEKPTHLFLQAGVGSMAGAMTGFFSNLYADEKPMIVFDDPFTNLDADKIAGGLKFLEEISKEYQVIYFTCHKDRTGDGK